MDRGSRNRLGWAPQHNSRAFPPLSASQMHTLGSGHMNHNHLRGLEDDTNVNPYECIDDERRSRHGSGVGFGGGNYHLGSGDGLDALSPGLSSYRTERSGSDGDGEEDSPPTHRHPHNQLPLGLPPNANPSNSLGQGGPEPGHRERTLGAHSHHLNSSSLRRSRSRPSAALYQSPVGHPATSAALLQQPPERENPYQQPYLGRSAGLSDSPTSENASDATLTDSELPFANTQSALPLQNGGLMLGGGQLDFSTNSARLNSLKRNLNSNGKSTTGIGHVNQNHNHNHDSLIDQFVMHTAGGKIYIPSDTPKNSTSDYKTSPSSSPSKKTSGSLLYKDTVHMGSLRDSRQRSKSDDDDYLYKIKGFCDCKKSAFIILLCLFFASVLLNILFGIGALPWGSESAKGCPEGIMQIDDDTTSMTTNQRQSTNGTLLTSGHINKLPQNPDEHVGMELLHEHESNSSHRLKRSILDDDDDDEGKKDIKSPPVTSEAEIGTSESLPIFESVTTEAISLSPGEESLEITSENAPSGEKELELIESSVMTTSGSILSGEVDEESVSDVDSGTVGPELSSSLEPGIMSGLPEIYAEASGVKSGESGRRNELEDKEMFQDDDGRVLMDSPLKAYSSYYYSSADGVKKVVGGSSGGDDNGNANENRNREMDLVFYENGRGHSFDDEKIDVGELMVTDRRGGTDGKSFQISADNPMIDYFINDHIEGSKGEANAKSNETGFPANDESSPAPPPTDHPLSSSTTLLLHTPPADSDRTGHQTHQWGGVCECYCPCMDKTTSSSVASASEEVPGPLPMHTEDFEGSGSGSGGILSDSDGGETGFATWKIGSDLLLAESNEEGKIMSWGSGESPAAEELLLVTEALPSSPLQLPHQNHNENHNYTTRNQQPLPDPPDPHQKSTSFLPTQIPHSTLHKYNHQDEILPENDIPIFPDDPHPQNPLESPPHLLFPPESPPPTPTIPIHLKKNDSLKTNSSVTIPGGRPFPAVNFPPDSTSFVQITIPSRLSYEIGAYSYWNMQFYQSEGAYVTWEISVPRGASIGFYARRNALPTHTHYDIVEILRGFKTRTTRSSPPSVSKEISNFLEQGHWFLSLYNDDGDSQEVVFVSSISEEMTEGCPNGCSGNGQCQAGQCQCNAGFGSDDCSQSVCPILCSGRGDYLNGECQCNPGWKGKECSLRHDECEVSDCNAHGKCVNGKCSCARGYKGDYCQEVDCVHPTCSGHGFCLNGNCMCKKGWRGADCASPDNEALQCLPDCSSHGIFNLESQTCTCEPRWTGEDCSQELCDTNCGPNGVCIGGGCRCSDGWTGTLCNQRVCDKRCGDHGQCKNGTCLCVTGWNGKHCTLEGCPNSCSGHGQCKANYEGFWECKCHLGWTGLECSVMMEQNCNDAKDNDKDGLTDCEDPECCVTPQCEKSQLCVSARKPIDILLRKQPPAITASFFEKMKFLIEEGSLQSYARQDAFNGSRSGVVRGQVVTPNGSGLMGVRVSSSSPLEPLGGFTLTQDDGWFDLMVNGGGTVTIQFGRSPFNSQTRTIFVPWNEVVIIDTVVMGSTEEKSFLRGQACDSHDYETMKPVVLATWKHGFQGDCSETSAILIESQVVQESIKIPGTGLHLMYHSSRVTGYLSTIQLQLTSETIPPSLKRVHLRITIEGVLFEKIFEADPDIKYTFSWKRLNVYRQRVYGVTTAIVKVGYEYDNCASIIWDVQSTTLSGHDMSISDIGGWNLDIHHRYNFHEGIIQKGDGSNIYLKHRPRVILTTMGNGYQRALDCTTECNGIASKQKLLAPVSLASSPDGNLFVGDFNLIRRIMVDGTVQNIVKLNATRVSYRYHMALSPVDNTLYISDPESHQIIRVRNVEEISDPEHNWEPVVGSGERCLPGDEAHCGDDALARDAKLAYPKGVAVSSDNVLFFADGTNIRKVDRDGIITTVIGNHQQKSHWKPIPCEGTLKVEEVHLRWPTELAVNPLDNSLYIIDDHMILKLTEDNRIRIIAGRPFHCPVPLGGYDLDLATHTALISPQSIAFASNGDLYVAESDSQRINRVRLITTDGKVSHFAGAESKCNCLDRGCSCYEDEHYLAATSKFNTVSAIAMSPDGVLHISDQGNYRIRSVMALIPQATQAESRQYEIFSPETQEIYIFNRFGQHVATKNIVTGETVYTFLYNVNMSNGRLSSVTDAAGNKIQILRDYSQQVKTIENAQAQKFNLKMSRVKMLQEFSSPEGYNFTFDYHGSLGLIKSRQDSSGRSSVYSYDEFGRLTMAVSPTGQVVTLNFDLSQKGASVKVTRDQNLPETILIKGSTVYKRIGKSEEVTSVHPDGSVIRLFPWSQAITTETVPYNILGDISPVLSDSFPVPGKQKTEIAGDLVNRVEWRYVARKEGRGKNKQVVQVDKKMRINGENTLMIEYDRETKSELVFIDDRNEILNVTYDRSGRPLKWSPSHGFAPVELEYDRFGRLTGWKWDELTEVYEYDRSGRLFKIQYADGTALTHAFKDSFVTQPMKMTTAGGSDYLLEYDNAGAFQSLTTPRGHIHTFGISTTIGVYEYQYKAPSSRDIYKIQYNDFGQIVSIVYPQGLPQGRVNYVYTKSGKLEAVVAGYRSARFSYQENTGLLKVAEVSQSSFEVKVEYKYHGGVVKEQREKYGSKTGLDNVHLKYQYDGNGRIANVEAEVNGKSVQSLSLKKSQNTGTLESILDMTVYQNQNGNSFNRTVIQDLSKVFFRTVDRDSVGRLRQTVMNLKGVEVFKLDIAYDSKGKIKHRKMNIGRSSYADNIQYDADGHVSEVMGSGNWKYVYDENGNAVQIVEQGEKSSLIYDSGDRVIQVGELLRYTYDSRGFLVQRGNEKFQYDDKGLLIHAVKKDVYKVWFFYDHLDRLISWKDDQGNVTQFLYANPDSPHQMTHIHFPLSGKNYLLLYDDSRNVPTLVALLTSDLQRFYVASDQNGSPLSVFNVHGTIVKEVHRTPFGKVVRDTTPEFYLPIDFHGGVVDKHTGIVIIQGRPYDPSIGQWMVPKWQSLTSLFKRPTDIFTYRFSQNNPITPRNVLAESRMTTLSTWLQLFGFHTHKIFGQDYVRPISVEPLVDPGAHLAPEFGAVSGLDCMANTITTAFKNLGFSRQSKLSPERIFTHESDLMARVAYKRTAFGPGLLVSRMDNGRALVSTVDNSVVQGVVTSVLNGSLFIDFRSTHQNTFYFVKDNPHKLRDDMEELKRLGGLYNISVHDAENGIKELRLWSGETSVSVRYGTDAEEEMGRLVKHAHRRAIERAWEEEKHYISLGLDGRRAWTEEEREQILSKGQVHGYRPSDLYSIHKFPQLADDPNNVLFQKDSRRKRRKSSKRHHDRLAAAASSSLLS